MDRVQREDRGRVVSKVRKTDGGAIVAPARLTRSGIFIYTNPDGSQRKELRPSEEVFKADSLETLAGVPVTVEHPGMVDSGNWKDLSVGHVGEDVKQDSDWVLAKLWVQDALAVDGVEKKNLVEVSCGYTCEYDPTPGTFEGENYDGVQRNIRYNHVGLGPVNWARAGRDARVMLDKRDTLMVDKPSMDPEKEIARLKQEIADAQARADKLASDLKSQTERADKAEGKVQGLEKQVQDLEDSIPVRADARASLLAKSLPILGSEFKADGKSDKDIKSEVVRKLDPSVKLDGKSEDFITGLYEALIKSQAQGQTAEDKAREDAHKAQLSGTSDTISDARKRMLERHQKVTN